MYKHHLFQSRVDAIPGLSLRRKELNPEQASKDSFQCCREVQAFLCATILALITGLQFMALSLGRWELRFMI